MSYLTLAFMWMGTVRTVFIRPINAIRQAKRFIKAKQTIDITEWREQIGQPADEWSSQAGGGRVQVSTVWQLPELASAAWCLERTERKPHSQSSRAARILSPVAVDKDLNPKIQKSKIQDLVQRSQ